MKHLVLFVFLIISTGLFAQYDAARYPVIPKPYSLLPLSGQFSINAETVILIDSKIYKKEVEHFRQEVLSTYGINLKYGKGKYSSNFIYVSDDSSGIPNEGYNLFVTRNEINLNGGRAGMFYGLQTLFQLLGHNEIVYDKDSNIVSIPGLRIIKSYSIPNCSIIDQPRFAWRGMHLDVSRHFFPKDSVKAFLNYIALYKFNTFHWHLTDDQGWRIEIKKYPKLTSIGAWRNRTLIGHEGANNPPLFDTVRTGGFYSQEEIREIIKYADSLHITIVPEIEMPGHALAMLAAYPELGCSGNSFSVSKTWGVFDDVLCPTEATFLFLDDILKEVCALFPGKYIHIGGDECPKARWKESSYCQELIKTNNLKDENELQSWFTKRIVVMLQLKGKNAIGWDEILDGGLAEGAAVMSWRGEEGGIAAAKAKHFVVMSPGSHCYFDHYQSQSATEPLAIGGYLPLSKVYSYNPIPSTLNADEQKYILGVQANVWTEYIPTFSQVQYMIFPRMAAMAEVAWDNPVNMNYDFFLKRLMTHLNLISSMKINYAKSIFEIKFNREFEYDYSFLQYSFTSEIPGASIYCSTTTDSVENFLPYSGGELTLRGGETIRAVIYDESHSKTIGPVFTQKINSGLAVGKFISLKKDPSTYYNEGGAFTLVDGITGRTPWVGSQWLGFSGDTLGAFIDLDSIRTVNEIDITFLQDHGNWIYMYDSLHIYFSEDGTDYTEQNCLPTTTADSKQIQTVTISNCKGKARYVYVLATALTKIPEGNPGAGNPAWLFVSEVEVK